MTIKTINDDETIKDTPRFLFEDFPTLSKKRKRPCKKKKTKHTGCIDSVVSGRVGSWLLDVPVLSQVRSTS